MVEDTRGIKACLAGHNMKDSGTSPTPA
jgi:hypothetical protein